MKKLGILLVIMITAALAGCDTGSKIREDKTSPSPDTDTLAFIELDARPTLIAENAKLNTIKPRVFIHPEKGQFKADWMLSEEMRLAIPEETMIQVWLIDEDKAKDSDNTLGDPFINDEMFNKTPFTKMVGVMIPERDAEGKAITDENGNSTFVINLKHRNSFEPYEKVMITLETSVLEPEQNPRPGTPIWLADINKDGKTKDLPAIPNALLLLLEDTHITEIKTTDLGKKLALMPDDFSLKYSVNFGKTWATLTYNKDPKIPAGSALEVWFIDRDLAGDSDAQFGPRYQKETGSPFALSAGQMYLQPENPENPNEVKYEGVMSAELPMRGFDEFVITLETDANNGDYDPRPGNAILYTEV